MAKFLDLVGLGKYDVKLKSYIGTITGGLVKEIDNISFDASKRELTVSYKNYNNESTTKSVVLPLATISAAGLMSAEQVQELEDLRTDVDDLAKNRLIGVKLNNVLFGVTNNVASADLSFALSDLKDYIVLSIGDTEIGKIPTADFVKDGMLSSATVVTVSESEATTERPAGKYIKLEWNTDSGKQDPTYIAVTDLLTQINIVRGSITNGTYVNVGLSVVNTVVNGVETFTINLTVDDDTLKSKLDDHETRISSLESWKEDINDYIEVSIEPALTDVANLKTTVGDSSSGLVKDAATLRSDLDTAVERIDNLVAGGGEPNLVNDITVDNVSVVENKVAKFTTITETEINNLF